MSGSNDTWDEQFELFGQVAGMVCVSVNYRLAPEHVFPAAIDDCLATAHWVIEHAQNEFGTSWLSIGGESAGAHLAASTLIRLREMGLAEKFSAANMLFGVFDLSLTPSACSLRHPFCGSRRNQLICGRFRWRFRPSRPRRIAALCRFAKSASSAIHCRIDRSAAGRPLVHVHALASGRQLLRARRLPWRHTWF